MTALPPYAELLRLRTEEVEGNLRFVMPWHEDVMGRPQFLHGGAIAGLLEYAAFATLRRALGDEAVTMKPVTVTVNYLLGGREQETFGEAIVERLGRTVANVDAFAWQDRRDRPIASARINFLLDR